MLTTLRRIVLEFSQNSDLESALLRMVTQVKTAMDTDCCSVYLADHQNRYFTLIASDGLAERSFGQTTIGFSEGLVGLVGQREEPINIADAKNHPHFIYAPEVEEDELVAFLGAPIIHQRKVLGVLTVQQKKTRGFNEEEEAFLVTLSVQLATAIANAEARGVLGNKQDNGKWLKQLQGIAGAPGIALGQMITIEPKADLRSVSLEKFDASSNRIIEIELFENAVKETRADFIQMSIKLSEIIQDDSLNIFEFYRQLLEPTNLGHEISDKIHQGWNAQSALKLVIDHYIVKFETLEDPYLRERVADIRDLGNRLLYNLQQQSQLNVPLPEQFILVAEDVTASMLAEYQHKGLQAIVSLCGSNNSHAAILAKALDLPAIMGVESIPLGQLNKQIAIVDGYSGALFVAPNQSLKNEYQLLIQEELTLTEKVRELTHLPTITQDGRSIDLLLNAGLSSGFEHSKHSGAIGIGLYRTEIPFMNRSSFPTEQEQTHLYKEVLAAFPQQAVTMRTLDVGGDKYLSYFPIKEDNPFLGWRGIRITLDHPEIFLVQVRAMMRASYQTDNLEIMLPMISNVMEVDDSIRLINQAYFELSSELLLDNGKVLSRPKIGIMLEVPSVIFQLKELAQRVDFFSVGSNDLTQYLLAVDRNNPRVSNLYDSYHPAVLRALNTIAQESAKHLVPLSLCGELASEPAGALLLLAMGYDKLSMNPHNIPKIKWVIRHVDYKQSKVILAHALSFETARQVQSYLNEQLEQLGLGGFIRAGM
jgi:phosphotransferase system enzyme I (PtsP)